MKEIIDKIKQLDSKGFLRDQIYTEYPELRDNVELKEYIIKESFPDKLFYLLKKYLSCKKHVLKNKKDIVGTRQLVLKKASVITQLRYLSLKNNFYRQFLSENGLDSLQSNCQRYLLKHN